MAYGKWKPSKSAKADFSRKMSEIEQFCEEHNIHTSLSSDSYYFTLNGINYRVSNHSPESSPYHRTRRGDTVYIHASKTRIIDIYNDLFQGYTLNGFGQRLF